MPKTSKTSTASKARSRRGAVKKTGSGWIPYGYITQRQLDAALEYVKNMSHAEMVQSLKDCGVLTPTGRLAKRYRSN